MSGKFLIFGATGAIGSSLAEQMKNSGYDNVHLVARSETDIKSISKNLGYSYTIADVLEENFIKIGIWSLRILFSLKLHFHLLARLQILDQNND